MKNILIVFLTIIFLASTANAQKVEHDITVVGMGNITPKSIGEFTYTCDNDGDVEAVEYICHSVIWQTNKTTAGIGGYFESWKNNNGLVFGGSFTKTTSILKNLNFRTEDVWGLDRYKFDVMYEHRFGTHRIQPYTGVGAYGVVLWGGPAPAHTNVNHSGFDGLVGLVTPFGINTTLNPRVSFKTGLLVDFGKASTYGDQTYQSSRNVMYEPQAGFTFKLGKVYAH